MSIRKGNLYGAVPMQLPQELFETLAESDRCRVERVISRGHTTPEGEWFDQPWEEWVAVLQGEATLSFEGGEIPLQMKPGDWVVIPAHCRHRVAATSTGGETIWLAVHYGDG